MTRTRRLSTMAAALLGATVLAGCTGASLDPYQREGIWKPSGVNDTNIAAHVAQPADLVRGREDPRGNVRMPTGAVERLWTAPAANREARAGGAGAGAGGGGGRQDREATR